MADLTARGLAPVGLDLSPYMARLARRRLLRRGLPLRLVRGRAQTLPFPDGAFANVIATFPADFILAPQTLDAVVRVLQPKGRLVIVAMGHLRGPGPLRRFVEWLYRITGQRDIPMAGPAGAAAGRRVRRPLGGGDRGRRYRPGAGGAPGAAACAASALVPKAGSQLSFGKGKRFSQRRPRGIIGAN